jgi:hypothetical protein
MESTLMSKFPTIAAVTLGLRDVIKAAMPPKVEVTTLPAAVAQEFSVRPRVRARVNVMFLRASPNPGFRNHSPALAREATGMREVRGGELGLHYLITVYGTPDPEEEQSTERLFERVYDAILRSPVFRCAGDSSDPGGAVEPCTARVLTEWLTVEDMCRVFSALGAEYRPTLACAVTPMGKDWEGSEK